MKKRKRVLSLLLAGFAAFGLFACDGEEAATETPPPEAGTVGDPEPTPEPFSEDVVLVDLNELTGFDLTDEAILTETERAALEGYGEIVYELKNRVGTVRFSSESPLVDAEGLVKEYYRFTAKAGEEVLVEKNIDVYDLSEGIIWNNLYDVSYTKTYTYWNDVKPAADGLTVLDLGQKEILGRTESKAFSMTISEAKRWQAMCCMPLHSEMYYRSFLGQDYKLKADVCFEYGFKPDESIAWWYVKNLWFNRSAELEFKQHQISAKKWGTYGNSLDDVLKNWEALLDGASGNASAKEGMLLSVNPNVYDHEGEYLTDWTAYVTNIRIEK